MAFCLNPLTMPENGSDFADNPSVANSWINPITVSSDRVEAFP
jgi:hypothetical protein